MCVKLHENAFGGFSGETGEGGGHAITDAAARILHPNDDMWP